MDFQRTPADRFADLPDWPYEAHFVEVDPSGLRMAFVDEGPRDAATVLLLHGEPSWSYLYRTVIPPLLAAGHRVVAPDLIGFGRSDKPTRREAFTYQRHLEWLRAAVIEALDLRDITMFCQDWGGLLGLRLLAEHPDRFARVVAANTFLPTGNERVPDAFRQWRDFSQTVPEFVPSAVLQIGTTTTLPDAVLNAYDAPFPDDASKAGARVFPALVPITPDDPASEPNRAAWTVLETLDVPFLCAFSDKDPVTRHGDKVLKERIPGAQGQPHTTIEGGGHFLQEDCGEQVAEVILGFMTA